MKTIFFAIIFFAAGIANAQVGIGTQTPSANAVLDVSSTDKGLLLPRIGDTTNVSNPSEGLVIYNQKTKAPAFHDGAKWNTVLSAKTQNADSVTYTITNAVPSYINGTFALNNFSNGITNTQTSTGTGRANFQDVIISKMTDKNTIAFTKAIITGTPAVNMIIEFKSYTPGASAPNYAIKLTTPFIISYQVGVSSDGSPIETIGMTGKIFGYKNYITNASYAWDVATNTSAAY